MESICIHIAVVLGSPQAVNKQLEEFCETADQLAESPDLGRILDDSELARPYRRFLCGSYWVFYRYDNHTLTIWRIVHTSRDIDDYTYASL